MSCQSAPGSNCGWTESALPLGDITCSGRVGIREVIGD
ncbi:unnamed protein product [Staurois parvus]|uniref:Uncharacterized protein n=1 Tax=Staurois parvus TaxID=386267 RepID=A0ABN9CHW0_9NEOB|nr:unnamed protein product [Staurois parvus]